MKSEFSAGGVVIRRRTTQNNTQTNAEAIEVLVAYNGLYKAWVFPKGHIGDIKKGESKEEAAIREVKEETGVEAVIRSPLRPITYYFRIGKETIRKTVHFFLMEFVSGDTENHDYEMEEVRFVTIEKAMKMLKFKDEKEVLEEARQLLVKGKA